MFRFKKIFKCLKCPMLGNWWRWRFSSALKIMFWCFKFYFNKFRVPKIELPLEILLMIGVWVALKVRMLEIEETPQVHKGLLFYYRGKMVVLQLNWEVIAQKNTILTTWSTWLKKDHFSCSSRVKPVLSPPRIDPRPACSRSAEPTARARTASTTAGPPLWPSPSCKSTMSPYNKKKKKPCAKAWPGCCVHVAIEAPNTYPIRRPVHSHSWVPCRHGGRLTRGQESWTASVLRSCMVYIKLECVWQVLPCLGRRNLIGRDESTIAFFLSVRETGPGSSPTI